MQFASVQESEFHALRTGRGWSDVEGWKLLYSYNVYRLCLALVLVALSSPLFRELDSGHRTLTLWGPIIGILAVSVVTFLNIHRRSPRLHVQAHLIFTLDVVFISILSYSHQLQEFSSVILYLTTVAATAVLFQLRPALFYASLCSLIILYHRFTDFRQDLIPVEDMYLGAVTVVAIFAVALVVAQLARKSRRVQTIVEQQGRVLADLDQINNIVVEHLEIGILFVDREMHILLINDVADQLLGDYVYRGRVTGKLARTIRSSLKNPAARQFNFKHGKRLVSMRTSPMRNGTLVHLEDHTVLNRKIQQTKLASVGRMATAISSEIRRPLDSISLAADQLDLDEFEEEEDVQLVDIVRKHSRRINYIIDSLQRRSAPGKARQIEIQLRSWLEKFIETFQQMIETDNLVFDLEGSDIAIFFDPTQLEQIITNLCQNSIKYARPAGGVLRIALRCGHDDFETPILEVTDNGQGIDESRVNELFEPFQTSDSTSTGLGLFLVREFCTLNGAEIEYFNEGKRHGFRISFQLQEDLNDRQ